jgi:hypothetical protein
MHHRKRAPARRKNFDVKDIELAQADQTLNAISAR